MKLNPYRRRPPNEETPPVMLTPAEQIPWPEVTALHTAPLPGVKLAICLVETPADRYYVAGTKDSLEQIRQTAPPPAAATAPDP